MRWLLRLLRLSPGANGSAERAHREAEAKLRQTRDRERQVRREVDQFAAWMREALRGEGWRA